MTPERMDEFQRLIGIENRAYAERSWGVLEHCKIQLGWIESGRKETPNAQTAKRRLDSIVQTSRKLATLLRNEPLAPFLLAQGKIPGSPTADGTDREWDNFAAAPANLILKLAEVSKTALAYLDDDEWFRGDLYLPPASKQAMAPAAMVLWPRVFDMWLRRGRTLAYTEDGPLHRLLKFIHEEFSLSAPGASALREAVTRHMSEREQK